MRIIVYYEYLSEYQWANITLCAPLSLYKAFLRICLDGSD